MYISETQRKIDKKFLVFDIIPCEFVAGNTPNSEETVDLKWCREYFSSDWVPLTY